MCHEEREAVFELLARLGARPIDVGTELTSLVPRLQGRPRRAETGLAAESRGGHRPGWRRRSLVTAPPPTCIMTALGAG